MEVTRLFETSVLTRSNGVTSQKTAFFIATAVTTSDLSSAIVWFHRRVDCIISLRPSDRNPKDVDMISQRLRRVEQLDRLPTAVLQQLAFCGYYEDLEKGVTRKYRMHFGCISSR
jgi:hypothetical protein